MRDWRRKPTLGNAMILRSLGRFSMFSTTRTPPTLIRWATLSMGPARRAAMRGLPFGAERTGRPASVLLLIPTALLFIASASFSWLCGCAFSWRKPYQTRLSWNKQLKRAVTGPLNQPLKQLWESDDCGFRFPWAPDHDFNAPGNSRKLCLRGRHGPNNHVPPLGEPEC